MDEIVYKRPGELISYSRDFTSFLPGDTTITNLSTVTAIDEAAVDATSTVVATIARSGMLLSCNFAAGVEGKDYTYTFQGIGTTTGQKKEHTVEVRVRAKIGGSV